MRVVAKTCSTFADIVLSKSSVKKKENSVCLYDRLKEGQIRTSYFLFLSR